MIDAFRPTSPVYYLVQALLNIFSIKFAESSAYLHGWFSCFHSLRYLGKTIIWDKRLHILSIIKKKSKGRKYARMRAVPLSSFSSIKVPVDPATLDAWEELLIRVFKPSLNIQGVQPKSSILKIYAAHGMNRPQLSGSQADLDNLLLELMVKYIPSYSIGYNIWKRKVLDDGISDLWRNAKYLWKRMVTIFCLSQL